VPLGHVADLVGKHARKLGLALRRDDQARMHADDAAGQREGVERLVLDQEEFE
jgi:hypothetical protein